MSSTKDSAQNVGTAVTGGIGAQNPSAALQDTTNSVNLNLNCIYEGVVVDADVITRLVSVNVNGTILEGCHVMANAVGSFAGVQDIALPTAGASVLVVLCPGRTYVLGGQLTVKGPNTLWAPPVTGYIDYDILDKSPAMRIKTSTEMHPVTAGLKMPIDMFPGEWVRTTGIGPALRLLFNFAQLDSGSLAKIETHLMNDMVRIVDNYFAHHHAGGDELIWNNVFNTWESHFTSYPHEAEGKIDKSEPLAEMQEKAFDPKSMCQPDAINATGRWRKSTYIGFLGDMIHTWITHPTEVASSYMEDADRATNFRQWIGSDGTYMVQAAGGLHLEAGGKPICPTQCCAWNDPNMKLKEALENLDSTYLKIWGNGPQWDDLKVSCWQMRSYLRYIPLWHSLARWKQLEDAGFCRIPIQSEAPEGNPGADEEDRKAVAGTDPYKGYAAINLSPAGTITITNGVRSSIIMDEKNIQIATAGNIELKAGGTLTLSGRDVVIQGADTVEISSFFGALVMKARTTLKALVEKGRMWFKSDMDPEDPAPPDYPLDGEQPEVEQKKYSIILDAPNGSILNYGKKGFVAATKDEEAHINFETAGKDSDINIVSAHDFNVVAGNSTKTKASSAGFNVPNIKFITSTLKMGEHFRIKGSRMDVGTIWAQSVNSHNFTGKSKNVNEKPDLEEPEFDADKADEVGDETKAMEKTAVVSNYEQEELLELKFEMPEWESETDALSWKSYKASIWDDSVNMVDDVEGEYTPLDLQETKLLASTRTIPTNLPWPGKEGKLLLYKAGPMESLAKPMQTAYTESDISTANDLTPSPFVRNYIKKDI